MELKRNTGNSMDMYLTPKQVAEMLQVTERTLSNQRHEKRGIPFIKIERAVRYSLSDIEEYLDSKKREVLAKELVMTGKHDEI